jgi:hypothetical protein
MLMVGSEATVQEIVKKMREMSKFWEISPT